jgi:beta-glucosidase
MALQVVYRVDQRANGPVRLGLGKSSVPLEQVLDAAPVGEWRTLKVRLACFRHDGEDLKAVNAPAWIDAKGGLALSLAELRLAPNQNDAVCP